MTYPPLSQARDTLNVQWYRSPMPPEVFRALSQRSDLKGWKQAGGHLALFAATGSFVWLFWDTGAMGGFCLGLVFAWHRWQLFLGHGTPRAGPWHGVSDQGVK